MPRRTVVAKLTIRSMSYDVGKRRKTARTREENGQRVQPSRPQHVQRRPRDEPQGGYR
jgi:hypothetical protein